MHHHLILRVVAKLLLPFILLYALYVQWHGDYGPGGGFQAGVIFAVGFILYALVFGVEALTAVVPSFVLVGGMALGLLLYAGTGVASMLLGLDYLDYSKFGSDPVHGQEWGILIVELGVGIAVASAMTAIFVAFAHREPDLDDKDW
ncbi:MAG: Na(+)/H(+) antiporter subunit B [Parvibaculum sp.]|uniref:Na(+)/H(+) antiporter subunit B n=1 Tax=Parvibaculum sp. TaxID=2024848 RepID=UPI0025DA8144|nr:Na(+)/H(+) antiporter subunit B [Parvibaculum sp.]MCE9649389.1 Na(+)/H(+) antiporter subunit B [Parvibaculum sp.]